MRKINLISLASALFFRETRVTMYITEGLTWSENEVDKHGGLWSEGISAGNALAVLCVTLQLQDRIELKKFWRWEGWSKAVLHLSSNSPTSKIAFTKEEVGESRDGLCITCFVGFKCFVAADDGWGRNQEEFFCWRPVKTWKHAILIAELKMNGVSSNLHLSYLILFGMYQVFPYNLFLLECSYFLI